MRLIKSKGPAGGIAAITQRLLSELEGGKRVLWLVSGGSQIGANVQIMNGIGDALSQNLTVTLVDERYGPPGHPDSNWAQLMAAGFPAKEAKLLPVIKDGLDFGQNAEYFNQLLGKAYVENDALIGSLGMGPDGHTAGILPGSPACEVSGELATRYEAPPLRRLTATFPAIVKLNAIYVLAFGDSKRQALKNLKKDLPLKEQPAQVFKHAKEAYVYNDQVGEGHV